MSLENLAGIGQLRAEAPDQREFAVLLRLAKNRFVDAQNSSLSYESRFDLASHKLPK